METGPFAEVAVPRFERLGGGGVGDDRVDPRPDLVHLGEVGQLDVAAALLGIREAIDAQLVVTHDRKLAGDARPGVGDQILVGLPSGGEDLEIPDAFALPAGP